MAARPGWYRVSPGAVLARQLPGQFAYRAHAGLNEAIQATGPDLKQFHNYWGLTKIARCGFPWKKATKRPLPSVYPNCKTAPGPRYDHRVRHTAGLSRTGVS